MGSPKNIFLFGIAVLAFSTGCLCDDKKFGRPNLLHPEHIVIQNERMKQFDPFTRCDIGPAIPGDRPRGMTRPRPAVQRYREAEPALRYDYVQYFLPD